jgi:hypothetical protein
VGGISVQQVLRTVAEFDEHDGASLGLVAWELFSSETALRDVWDQAIACGWLKPAGHDAVSDEQLWRLTLSGRTLIIKSDRLD